MIGNSKMKISNDGIDTMTEIINIGISQVPNFLNE